GGDLRARVQAPRRLRQHPFRLQHPRQPHRPRHPHHPSPIRYGHRKSFATSVSTPKILQYRRVMTNTGQPYEYRRVPLVEPDWTRFPGWGHVTAPQWESAQWQRVNCVKNIKQLRAVMGDLLDDAFYADLETDQQRLATMSMLVTPQMLNTMVPDRTPD